MFLTGKARIAGVIGWPVSHSRSPRLHGHWLRAYGIDGAYIPLAVPPEHIEQAIRALPVLGFAGVNVTVPHKEAALRLADEVDDFARRLGAANTLVVKPDGHILASNSDAYGFIQNLREGAPGFRADAGPAVMLGSGGAARAVVVALADAGAREIRIVNRTSARAEELCQLAPGIARAIPWTDMGSALADAALLVNTTSLGMDGQPALEIDLGRLPTGALVNDIVYTPLETPLLKAAAARGNPVVDGLGMLLHQARPGFKAWFGREPEVTEDLRRVVLGR
jgi:shikimate dehydrogenase